MTDPSIKILVSCHKETYIPDSDLYLPVHVGAERSSLRLKGMQPDDDGENISEKNFTFCELSAQYWAWKNLDADYIGLCHYRRFFCFDGEKHRVNDHAQIEIEDLDGFSVEEYRLNDTDLIKSVVLQHDGIVPQIWDVFGVPTPSGPKQNIRDHMIAYGLLNESDLELLIKLVQERQPEYLNDLIEYLNGRSYLGYNCFILKRDLFNALSEFEFDVLLEFDKKFDYEGLTTTRKRICGYLGEILFSTFILHLRKVGNADIVSEPLTFFFNTDKPYVLDEVIGDENISSNAGAACLVWRMHDHSEAEFAVALESFFDFIECRDDRLTISIIAICNSAMDIDSIKGYLGRTSQKAPVIWLRENMIDLSSLDVQPTKEELHQLLPFLIPWLLPKQSRIYWCDGLAVFSSDVDLRSCLIGQGETSVITDNSMASRNLVLDCELNKPNNWQYASLHKSNCRKEKKLGTACMIINAEHLRSAYTASEAIEKYNELHKLFAGNSKDGLSEIEHEALVNALLYELSFESLPFSVVAPSLQISETSTWANSDTLKEWNSAEDPCAVIYRPGSLPEYSSDYKHFWLFWSSARKSRAYEMLLRTAITEPLQASGGGRDALRRVFPSNTRRGRVVRKLALLYRH